MILFGGFTEVYKTKSMEYLSNLLKVFTPETIKCIIIYGPIGVGKTFTAKYLANELGYEYVDYGNEFAGTIDEIINVVKTKSLTGKKKVVLLDRPLMWLSANELKKVLANTSNPIIIECTDKELKYYKHFGCVEIQIEPPPKTWIVSVIKKYKLVEKPKYNMVTDDVRQSLMLALGSDGYKDVDWIKSVEHYLKTGDADTLELSHLPVLLDTGVKAFYGIELYRFMQYLVVADLLKDMKVLAGLKPNIKNYTLSLRYYEKVKSLKEK